MAALKLITLSTKSSLISLKAHLPLISCWSHSSSSKKDHLHHWQEHCMLTSKDEIAPLKLATLNSKTKLISANAHFCERSY
eukprot:10027703-Karenia_brevis.AAC.1